MPTLVRRAGSRALCVYVDCDFADPALLNRCATFFLDHGQYQKAVQLLIAAKQLDRALNLCVEEKVAPIVCERESQAGRQTPNRRTTGGDNRRHG